MSHSFSSTLRSPSGWGNLLIVPTEIALEFKAHHGHRTIVTVNDRYSWHAALMFHGEFGHYIMMSKDKLKKLDLEPDEGVEVQLEPDTSKYGAELPEEFEAVLDTDPEGQRAFEGLTDGAKRSLIFMVSRYKTTDGRIEKALDLLEKLKMGITDRKILSKKGL